MIKRTIEKAVKNAFILPYPQFKKISDDLRTELENSNYSSRKELVKNVAEGITKITRNYREVSSGIVIDKLLEDPLKKMLFYMAISNPRITGLSDEYTTDYLADNGLDATATFAICYYMMTRKSLTSRDVWRMNRLDKFNQDLENKIFNWIGLVI